MLTIRLQRVGKIKKPTYRLIVSEKSKDTQGTYVELLGSFNPHAKENAFLPKAERVSYWLSKGATTSTTVHNLLTKAGIVKETKKRRSVFLSTKRAAKLAAKKQAAAEKAPTA